MRRSGDSTTTAGSAAAGASERYTESLGHHLQSMTMTKDTGIVGGYAKSMGEVEVGSAGSSVRQGSSGRHATVKKPGEVAWKKQLGRRLSPCLSS